jgi:hypothetical protein
VRPSARSSSARAAGVRADAHLREDLRCAAHPRDVGRQGLRALVEQLFGPLAQLDDARIARAQLFGGVGDLVVVELVQVVRLAEVLRDGIQRCPKILRQTLPELGDREGELVARHADALVRRHERDARPTSEVGVVRVELRLLLSFSLAPESGHTLDPKSQRPSGCRAPDAGGSYTAAVRGRGAPAFGGRPRRGRSLAGPRGRVGAGCASTRDST